MSGAILSPTLPTVNCHINVAPGNGAAAISVPSPVPAEMPEGVTPEVVAVIEAAVAEFLGSKARILSVKVLDESNGDSNAWATQGRDMVQASHNLVQRGH